jgi:hypothetical protein
MELNRILKVKVNEDYNSTKKIRDLKYFSNYYWENNLFFIEQSGAKEFLEVVNIINNSPKPVIKKGKNIYASKVSEIPRFKLKEYISENGLKKTSRKSKCDYIILNKGYLNNLTDLFKIQTYSFLKKDFFQEKVLNTSTTHYSENNTSYILNTFTNSLNQDICGVVYDDDEYLKKIFKNRPKDEIDFYNNINQHDGVQLDFYRDQKSIDLLELIIEHKENIKKGNIKIVFDEDLFVELNKDGIELDDDYLEILKDMLFSDDKANIKLGFEMISNLIISPSTLLSIAFLLNELYNDYNFRPSQYTQNNTNLKSLLTLFKTKNIQWQHGWKAFGTGLRLNFKEGKEGEIVKKFLLDNINKEFKLNNSASEALVDIVFATEAN